MMNHGICVLLVTFIVHKDLASAQENSCKEFGAIQLSSSVHYYEPNVGRVNFCNGSQWGTICRDGWDHFDAAVVCRELGYTADGAQPQYYTSNENDTIMINNVDCSSDELRLRDCPYSNYTMTRSCRSGGVAGVRCRVIKSIDFARVSNSVLVTWKYSNVTSRQPSSFDVRCNGQQHYYNIISVSNGTSRVTVGKLLPNVSYDCCVSAKYARNIVTTEIRCASIRSEDLLTTTDTFIISGTCANMMATVYIIVGAVLSCIIVILLVLLAVCGGALLRSRTSPEAPKRSSAEMIINRNISYETTEIIVNGNISYETIGDSNPSSRQQPLPSERNRVSASLSENYVIEYSEPHQATGGGGEKDEVEALHEDYLQLQH